MNKRALNIEYRIIVFNRFTFVRNISHLGGWAGYYDFASRYNLLDFRETVFHYLDYRDLVFSSKTKVGDT